MLRLKTLWPVFTIAIVATVILFIAFVFVTRVFFWFLGDILRQVELKLRKDTRII